MTYTHEIVSPNLTNAIVSNRHTKKRDGIMTVRIPSDEKEMLQAIAHQYDATLSDVVVRAVREFIQANPIKGSKPKK